MSDLVENYLALLVDDTHEREKENSPLIDAMRGAFSAPEDFDYKEEFKKIRDRNHQEYTRHS